MDEELTKKLKYIRMTGLLNNWEKYLSMAQKSNFSSISLLKYIVEEEYNLKKENSRLSRLRRSKISEPFVIETFPFEKIPKLNKKKLLTIYDSFDYIEKPRNIIFIGKTGRGKTGLATSFLMQAINKGYSCRFILFSDLISELYKSVADHTENKVLNNYISYDCLAIDEMGYLEMEKEQVNLFFTLMHKRHKKKSTIITTNLGFSEWNTFLKNPHLTAALVDRLTEESHVIKIESDKSLRPTLES